MIDKTRETALKVLYRIDKEKAYSNIVLNQEIKKNKELTQLDISFISELIYGVTNWKLTIDTIIEKYSKIKLKKISDWILNILRLGIYQIIWLDKVPKSAAVNESVNLAKRYGHSASSNFVNAILRKVTKQDLEELQNIKNPIERISKMYSMPIWIVEKLLNQRDINIVENICQELTKRPKVIIRRNNLKVGKEEFEKLLQENKIEFQNSKINSLFYIQEGWDIYINRTNLVKENAKRLGITIIDEKQKDATIYYEEYIEKFDKILLDVPCLGIGVIKRKPDIKWQKELKDVEEITKIQKKILETCTKYLKPGGILIYSTCSILKEENEETIEKFLKENDNFKLEKMLDILPQNRQDGFFIAKIKKT